MHSRALILFMTTCLVAATAAPLAAQAAPTNVSVVAGPGTATISWTGIRNTEVSYRVLRAPDAKSPGSDLTRPLGPAVHSFVDASAAAGTTYFYQVIAVYANGSQGASAAVQFPAPVAATAMPTVTRAVLTGPLTAAPPMALRAPAVTLAGQFNRVTLSWRPVSTNIEPVTYEVRRARVDPATPGAAIGYISTVPALQTDGSVAAIDREADLHLPTWYRLTTRSTSQGSVDSPWYRRDPPPHHGVDTISGGYWRVTTNTKMGPSWVGCVRFSEVPGANMYWARVRTASGPWVDLVIDNQVDFTTASASFRRVWFETTSPKYAALFQPLENGGQIVEVQVGPMFSTAANRQNAPYLTDLNHLQPVVVSFAPRAPLGVACQ